MRQPQSDWRREDGDSSMMKSMPCACCECQGKKCLAPHPGHSHHEAMRAGISEQLILEHLALMRCTECGQALSLPNDQCTRHAA